MKIYSLGYGNVRTVKSIVKTLKKRGIETLVDVRTTPFSKWKPEFNRHEFKAYLEKKGIKYLNNKALGGKEDHEMYPEALADLVKMSKTNDPPIALMCSEQDPRKCHRYKKIGEDLIKKNIRIVHIESNDIDWEHPRSLFD